MKIQPHGSQTSVGFPSPADDHLEHPLDLNDLLIQNRLATFFLRVDGSAMECAGVQHGDLIIVDRSIQPSINKIVVVVMDGELVLRRVCKIDGKLAFAKNDESDATECGDDYQIWGVATNVVRPL